MKIINNIISGFIFGSLLCVGGTVLTGCSDTFPDDIREGGSYTGPHTLVVPIGVSENAYRTRSSFDSDIKINEAWVGIFEANTGRLIGKKAVQVGFSGSTSHNAGVGVQAIEFDNLYLNDNENEVYIAGVANYGSIEAYAKDGSIISLEQALENVNSLEDYRNLAVSVSSAKSATDTENQPLMSGFYSSGHGNFTLDQSGIVNSNNASNAKVTFHNLTTRELILPDNGLIHLRRLFSHVKVNITAGDNVEISNPSFQVFNIPQSVFLQERTHVENVGAYSSDNWSEVTPASSDIYGGYVSFDNALSAGQAADGSTYEVHQDDAMQIDGNSIKFGYWHFENKHWGLADCTTYSAREKSVNTADGTRIFTSLNPGNESFNNGASYFVINAYVKDRKNNIEGQASFLIHEGYSCSSNGESSTGDLSIASRDFSTFRNTEYTYNIKINGLNNLLVNVTTDDLDLHNGGVSGDIYALDERTVKSVGGSVNNAFTVSPDAQIGYRIVEVGPSGNVISDYYEGFQQDDELISYFSNLWPAFNGNQDATLASAFSLVDESGKSLSLSELVGNPSAATYSIKAQQYYVDGQSEDGTYRVLYLFDQKDLEAGDSDTDGCSTIHKMLSVSQIKNQVPKLPAFSSTDYSIAKFVDQYLTITVPSVNSLEYGVDYVYELTSDGKTYTSYTEKGSSIEFNLPVSALKNKDSVTLSVKALDPVYSYLEEGSPYQVAYMNITAPNWTQGDKGDWDAALSFYAGNTNTANYEGKYLKFYPGTEDSGKTFSVQNNGIKFNTNPSQVKFTVYKNCTVTITTTASGGNVALMLDGVAVNQDASSTTTSAVFMVNDANIGNGKEVTIYRNGGSFLMTKIQLN